MVDDHSHFVVFADAAEIGRVGRAIRLALRALGADLEPADVRPVENRAHMQHLVGYLLTQPQHHELTVRPSTWSGSCFPDLVGARVVPGVALRLDDALPRYRLRDACASVLLPDAPLVVHGDEILRRIGVVRIVEAATAAFAAPTAPHGRSLEANRARQAAAVLARAGAFGTQGVADALVINSPGRGAPDARRPSGAPVQGASVSHAKRTRSGPENAPERPLKTSVNDAVPRTKVENLRYSIRN